MVRAQEGQALPQAITINEAADHLGLHYMTVYKYVRTGRLPAEKEGAEWRIDPADLRRLQRPAPARRTRQSRAARARQLESRLVEADEGGAWAVVENALSSAMRPEQVYLELLLPSLVSIGDRWESAELDVADEHRASCVALRIIGRLGPRFRRNGRTRGTIIVGAPAGERHAIGSAVVADLLRARNFDVIDLGGDTPASSFVHAASGAERLRAIGIGVTIAEALPAAAGVVHALDGAGIEVPVGIGGAAVADDQVATRLGAAGFTGATASRAVAVLEELAEGVSVV